MLRYNYLHTENMRHIITETMNYVKLCKFLLSLFSFQDFFRSLFSKPVLSDEGVTVTQLCQTLCHPIDCSLPGPSAHGILQARILKWVAIPFFRNTVRVRHNNSPESVRLSILIECIKTGNKVKKMNSEKSNTGLTVFFY